jgi:osmotically-inducible protein OsmY
MRPDQDILDEVWDALWGDDQIRVLERDNIAVTVKDGTVTLRGHVANSLLADVAEEIAASVPGVTGVVNRLVADLDLENAVGAALAADPATKPYILRVGAYHGWLSISGQVPSAEVQLAVQAVAVKVPGVRGVLGLPSVAGAPAAGLRRAIQPKIGAIVYADDGMAGRVRFVVIDPQTRLVTAIGVRGRFDYDSQSASGEFLAPLDRILVVSEGGVFLSDTLAQVAARTVGPDLAPPPAAPEWEPLIPYESEQVRWPHGAQA